MIALIALISGLYIILFGIYTVSSTHMLGTGIVLTFLGVLTTSLSLLLLWNRHVAKKYSRNI